MPSKIDRVSLQRKINHLRSNSCWCIYLYLFWMKCRSLLNFHDSGFGFGYALAILLNYLRFCRFQYHRVQGRAITYPGSYSGKTLCSLSFWPWTDSQQYNSRDLWNWDCNKGDKTHCLLKNMVCKTITFISLEPAASRTNLPLINIHSFWQHL